MGRVDLGSVSLIRRERLHFVDPPKHVRRDGVFATPQRGAASLPLFRPPPVRASHFSLRAQRKVTKRKSTPMQRSPGSCPPTARSGSGGCLTVHPWTGSQLARIPASHPSGLSCATPPLHRGPGHCASCAAKTKQLPARCGCRCGFAFRFRAHDARYSGPLDRGEAAQELSVGWPTRCGPVRCQSMDGLASNPGAASRTWSTGTVRKARVWGGLSLGYFSLATQREVTCSPKASESLFGIHTVKRHRQQTRDCHCAPARAGATNSWGLLENSSHIQRQTRQ
jgi:hypothetical protein